MFLEGVKLKLSTYLGTKKCSDGTGDYLGVICVYKYRNCLTDLANFPD